MQDTVANGYTAPEAPLSIGGVLDDGFRLTRAVYRQVFIIALVGAIASNLPTMLLEVDEADPLSAVDATLFLLILISALISFLIFGWAIKVVHHAARGERIALREAASHALVRFPVLLLAVIAYGFATAFGLIAFFVPGVILGLTFLFAPYLVVTEDAGVLAAFKTSHGLVWGNWWRTAAIMTVLGFVLFVLYFVIAFATGVLVALQGVGTDAIIAVFEWVLVPLLSAAYMPVMYACTVAVLNDLKLRKRGADLEARLQQMEAP